MKGYLFSICAIAAGIALIVLAYASIPKESDLVTLSGKVTKTERMLYKERFESIPYNRIEMLPDRSSHSTQLYVPRELAPDTAIQLLVGRQIQARIKNQDEGNIAYAYEVIDNGESIVDYKSASEYYFGDTWPARYWGFGFIAVGVIVAIGRRLKQPA